MFFRNLTLFRFSAETADKLATLPHKIDQHQLRPCGPLEMATRGWVSPYGLSRGDLIACPTGAAIRNWLISLGGETKILPMSTINKEVSRRCADLEAERGRPVGARERRKLKDDVITDLLPRALTRPSRLAAFFDLADGWLVVDTSSRKQAEDLVSQLRETLGTFPAVQAEAEENPVAIMTEWLIGGSLPDGFELGDEIELKDPADQGAVVRCRRHDLAGEEVREHLKCGKRVTQLGLIYRERLSFVLDDLLTVRKFKMLDLAVESLDQCDRESAEAEINARFALMSLEVRQLLASLETVFSIHRPAGK